MNVKPKTNDKIRIAHVLFDLYVGGAEILLLHLIKGLGFEKYKHYVYYFGSDGPIREKVEAMGVTVTEGKKLASIKQPLRFATTLYSLANNFLTFIKNHQIQIIQSHLSQPNQLSVITGKLSGVPAFPTIHNTMAFTYRRSRWDFRA
jgi:Glycosyltransferase Family 4